LLEEINDYIEIHILGSSLKNWYRNIQKGQKIFVYLVSTALILVFGIGLLPLTVLIYLELGQKGNT
jgi:hypothetical protein